MKKKERTIRKTGRQRLASRRAPKSESQPEQHQQPEENEKVSAPIEKEPESSDELAGMKSAPALGMRWKEVSQLEGEHRALLKTKHPSLAPYIFMSQREKSKFFHEKNLAYRKSMETPGNMKARAIRFKKTYEVLLFGEEEPAARVEGAKKFRDRYDPKIHYS